MRSAVRSIAAGALMLSALQVTAGQNGGMFIVHDLTQSPQEAAAAVRSHAQAREDWLFLADFTLAGGAVTAVKVCYLPLGKDIMAAGMHVMAMMPCGHLAFYEQDGQTKLSMLDLKFMSTLNPDPHLDRAAQIGRPAFAELLDEALGIEPDAAS